MDNFYTKVPNTVIRDNSLTCEARLLYCYMLSMEDGWRFYRSSMASALGVSRQKLNRVVSELVDAGLVERKGQDRGKGGIFSAVNYSVVTITDHGCTDHGCTDHGKSDHLRITIDKNNNYKEENNLLRHAREEILSLFSFSDGWKRRMQKRHDISAESLEGCIEGAIAYASEFGMTRKTKSAASALVSRQIAKDCPPPAGTLEERRKRLVQMLKSDGDTEQVSASVKNEFYAYYTAVDDKGWLRYERDNYFNATEALKKWIKNGSKENRARAAR